MQRRRWSFANADGDYIQWSKEAQTAGGAPRQTIHISVDALLKSVDARSMWGRISTSAALACIAQPALATSQKSTLVQVFDYNPSIAGQRAGLEAKRLEIDIAKADARFDFRLKVNAQHEVADQTGGKSSDYLVAASAEVSLPIWSGGRTTALINRRRAGASAEGEDFRRHQNDTLAKAVEAHLAVARDRAVLRLYEQQTVIIAESLHAARERARLGDLTLTDVDQARARLASSAANVSKARAATVSSEWSYWTFTGKMPDQSLELDERLPPIPGLWDIPFMLTQAPAARAANFRVFEAQEDARYARALRAPTISLFASFSKRVAGSQSISFSTRSQATAGVRVTFPLYQGGGPGAKTRAATAIVSQTMEDRTFVERTLTSEIRARYALLKASDQNVVENRAAFEAAMEERKSTEMQNKVGDRTFLEVLNAQSLVLAAELRLLDARVARVSHAYAILGLFGKLDGLVERSQSEREEEAQADKAEPSVRQKSSFIIFGAPELEGWDLKQLGNSRRQAKSHA